MTRSSFTLLHLMLMMTMLLLILPGTIHAWGKDGHEMIGNLAFRLLSNKTQAVVRQILVDHPMVMHSNKGSSSSSSSNNNDKNTPLGAIADWADQVRASHDYHWSGPLHYIDIHDNLVAGGCPVYDQNPVQTRECRFEYDRDCSNDICVAGAIVNYTQHLSEYNNKNHEKNMDLKHPTSESALSLRLRGSSSMVAPWSSWWDNWLPFSRHHKSVGEDDDGDVRQQQQHQQQAAVPTKLVQESLMFLTHFVGDIHQPLHSARTTDRGGNTIDVTFDEHPHNNHYTTHRIHNDNSHDNDGKETTEEHNQRRLFRTMGYHHPYYRHYYNHNSHTTTTTNQHQTTNRRYSNNHHKLELHAVWDSSMIIRAIHTTPAYNGSRMALEDELFQTILHAKKSGEINAWLACSDTSLKECTSAWAQESFDHAMTWAYANADNTSEVVSGTHLTDDYYETRLPQIQHYLAVAGARLAAALELVLGASEPSSSSIISTAD